MENFYLSSLISKDLTNKEKIIEILRRRGFFIDKEDDKYFLSDNADVEDALFLDDCFEKFHLGKVINDKEYKKSKRRQWNRIKGISYPCNSLKPNSVEIIVDENTSINDVIRTFFGETRISNGLGDTPVSWREFAIEVFPPKVPVCELEPYVSFYVKAISSCGVYTYHSCDGNHKDGGSVYVWSNYPSKLFHECVWNEIICKKYGSIPYIGGEGLIFDEKTQAETYCLVNQIASFLYKNRKIIRNSKIKASKELKEDFFACENEIEKIEKYRSICKVELEKIFCELEEEDGKL